MRSCPIGSNVFEARLTVAASAIVDSSLSSGFRFVAKLGFNAFVPLYRPLNSGFVVNGAIAARRSNLLAIDRTGASGTVGCSRNLAVISENKLGD
jgi:hypothetical protein